MKPRLYRLRDIFFVVLTLLSLVPAGVIGVLLLNQLSNNVTERFDSDLVREANQLSYDLRNEMDTFTMGLAQFSDRIELARGLNSLLYTDELRRILIQFHQTTSWIDAVYAIDTQGFVVEGSGGSIGKIENSQLVSQRLSQNSKSRWCDIWKEPGLFEDSDYAFATWVPVSFHGTRSTSELVGYILVIVSMDQLLQAVQPTLLSGEYIRFYRNRELLASSLPQNSEAENYRSYFSYLSLDKPLLKDQQLELKVELLQPIEWREVQVDEAVSTLTTVVFGTLFFCLILAALISLWLTDIFNRLLSVVAQYRLGNYQDPPNYKPRTVEVLQVVNLLQAMGKQIQHQVTDLKNKNRDLADISGQLQQTNHLLEQKVAERTAQLEQQALTDGLTGVGNRQAFEEALDVVTNNQRHFGLFVIDINGLKPVNDELGHQYGDQLIAAVADLLTEKCRKQDGLFRIGGDEFVVLMPGADREGCRSLANRLTQACDGRIIRGQNAVGETIEMPIHFSLGFALSREVGHHKVLESADQSMYQAKRRYYSQAASCARRPHELDSEVFT